MKHRAGAFRVVIVGAGISGLTAAAYLAREGHEVTILEKTHHHGGLVQSFEREGFTFDTGPRAIGNAGIVLPMMKDLGLSLQMVPGRVSTGIADRILDIDSLDDINKYCALLQTLFPDAPKEIKAIRKRFFSCSKMMARLNRVENPLFKNLLTELHYLFLVLIPWLPSFALVVLQNALSNTSIEQDLAAISGNTQLNDMVSQHFFKGTPKEFAFGYFFNFLDYYYPVGGTGQLADALMKQLRQNGGRCNYATIATELDPAQKAVIDQNGTKYPYDALIWAADLKTLYSITPLEKVPPRKKAAWVAKQALYQKSGATDSVFSLFVATSLPPDYFSRRCQGHFIYTPSPLGLGQIHRGQVAELLRDFSSVTESQLWDWLGAFCARNSYEISIPVLKDASLAPPGKTALIISLLLEGELCQKIQERGWYDDFKQRISHLMIETLSNSVFPDLDKQIIFSDSASPCTLQRLFGTWHGSISGWNMQDPVPVTNKLAGIMGSVKTPLDDIYQAGQWTYSPSGVPVAVLTGRIAALKVNARAKKARRR